VEDDLHRKKAGNGEKVITVLQRNPRDSATDLISVNNFLYFTCTKVIY